MSFLMWHRIKFVLPAVNNGYHDVTKQYEKARCSHFSELIFAFSHAISNLVRFTWSHSFRFSYFPPNLTDGQ